MPYLLISMHVYIPTHMYENLYTSFTLLFWNLCSLVQVLRQELQSVNFIIFQSLHAMSPSILNNLFSFKFWANLTFKNVGGNHIVQTLYAVYLQNSTTKNSQKHDQLSHAMSDFCDSFLFAISSSKRWYMVCPKIFMETCKPTLFTFTFCYHVVQNTWGFSGYPYAGTWAPRFWM